MERCYQQDKIKTRRVTRCKAAIASLLSIRYGTVQSVSGHSLTSEAQTYLSRLRRDSVGANFQSVCKLTERVS